jgi:hypothetical protein
MAKKFAANTRKREARREEEKQFAFLLCVLLDWHPAVSCFPGKEFEPQKRRKEKFLTTDYTDRTDKK